MLVPPGLRAALTILAAAALSITAPPRPASAQTTASHGNVTLRLSFPPGVTKARGVLTFTARGLAGGWAGSAGFRELATRLQAAIAVVQGGDDLNDASYPGRCKSGEFNNIPEAFKKLAAASNHPELEHAPLVGIGHSHGGDYWNWFNACHPERMAMVFVHASGGVNYSGAALKTPVLYELGTGDLIENGSKKPRAGMFANRSKGAPMTLVLGQGEGHDNVSAASLAMVITIIEETFKLRVPADADPASGPVRLNELDEASGSYWLGNLYSKEIAPYASYAGNKALTSFLPNEEVARKWKETGPGLPMNIELPSGTCAWCGNPTDEPKASPAPPPADAGAPGGGARPDAGSAADRQSADSSSPPTTEPRSDAATALPDAATATRPETPPPAPANRPRRAAGGCSVGPAAVATAAPVATGVLALLTLLACAPARRRGRRSR